MKGSSWLLWEQGAAVQFCRVAVFLPIFLRYLDRMLAAIKERTSSS